MPRIEDIGVFNAVREAGLNKLVPPVPRIGVGMGTCGRGNGAEGLYHAFIEAIERSGTDFYLTGVGMLRRMLPGTAGQYPRAGAAPAHPAPGAGQRCRADYSRHFRRQHHAGVGVLQDRGMGPHHGIDPLRAWLSRGAGVERDSLLQGTEEDRAAQLRPDQSRRHRGIHRRRRLPGTLQSPDRREAGEHHRADQGGQAARPRRRRLPHRQQVGVPAQGGGRPEVHHLQRRRRRSRRVHEPQRDRKRSALDAGRHDHRRIRDGRDAGNHLRARRVSAGGTSPAERPSSRRTNTACWATTSWAAASSSTSRWWRARARSSAEKRPH